MAGLGKGVPPERCPMNGALGFHNGLWYFLLNTKGKSKPRKDRATHVFQCHYCDYERYGRPNDELESHTRAGQETQALPQAPGDYMRDYNHVG